MHILAISVHEKSLASEASLSYMMPIRPPRARDQDAALPKYIHTIALFITYNIKNDSN